MSATPHRFTVEEYYRMGEIGVLKPDARVELLDGFVIDKAPISPLHGGTVKSLIRIFGEIAGRRFLLSVHDPVHLSEYSEPEPDLMLLRLKRDHYGTQHPGPDDVFLLIEVADTTLELDRNEKVPAYAAAGIREVWLVNLNERQIEIYREPHVTGYRSNSSLRPGDTGRPSAFPDITIDVTEVLRQNV